MKKPHIYDVVIIGAGSTGCAVLRELTLAGSTACLVEAGPDILAAGASKGDPGILRSGFNLPAKGRSLACVKQGRAVFQSIKDRLNLPLLPTKALVVARNQSQLDALPRLQEASLSAGNTAHILSAAEVKQQEPHLTANILGAMLVDDEAIVDPWSTPLALVWQALAHGAECRFLTKVKEGSREDGVWTLNTTRGTVRGKVVINCAGMQADLVEAIRQPDAFRQQPRKEQYLCYAKAAPRLLQHIIYPGPGDPNVALFPSTFGNVMAGPFSITVKERANMETQAKELGRLERSAKLQLPALAEEHLHATYARVRPANQDEELYVSVDKDGGWITIAGVATLGIAGALGAGAMAAGLLAEHFQPPSPVEYPQWPAVPMLSGYKHRPWQNRAPGDFICHCEHVTQAEVEATFQSPLPPGDLEGLKRRTRAGMGLCQGDGCAHLTTLFAAKAKPPLRAKPPYEPTSKVKGLLKKKKKKK